jgi:enoyl-[acyl-carrier protein] reductase I
VVRAPGVAAADAEAFFPVPSHFDMTDFAGKCGLIVGVANKYSIAWAIAQAVARRGARLALTYQGRFEDHVNKLAGELPEPPLVLPCDVTSDDEIKAVFERLDTEFGGLDFLLHGAAFAPPAELDGDFLDTSRDGFRTALDISAYSLIALTRGAVPLMEKRGGGSVLTLTYLGSDRVFPHYNVMGVAKAALESSVRYLAAAAGPKNIRVNAVSAGPIKTVAARGISGFSDILKVYPERAPLRRNVDTAEVAESAAFLLSDAGRGITGEVLMVDAGYHAVGM